MWHFCKERVLQSDGCYGNGEDVLKSIAPFRRTASHVSAPRCHNSVSVLVFASQLRWCFGLVQSLNLHVGMTCDGCANAVKRIAGKIAGVASVETDVPAQRVHIVTDGSEGKDEEILAALRKWGTAAGKAVERVES